MTIKITNKKILTIFLLLTNLATAMEKQECESESQTGIINSNLSPLQDTKKRKREVLKDEENSCLSTPNYKHLKLEKLPSGETGLENLPRDQFMF